MSGLESTGCSRSTSCGRAGLDGFGFTANITLINSRQGRGSGGRGGRGAAHVQRTAVLREARRQRAPLVDVREGRADRLRLNQQGIPLARSSPTPTGSGISRRASTSELLRLGHELQVTLDGINIFDEAQRRPSSSTNAHVHDLHARATVLLGVRGSSELLRIVTGARVAGGDGRRRVAHLGRFRWRICALLFAATTLNYLDRQVLGVLAPDLTRQFGWSEIDYGYIVTAFQAAYAIGLVSAGALIDKLGTRIGYALAICVWSLAAMSHALAGSVLGFAAARFLLGLGEAGNFPAAIKTVAEWFPRRERAFATGIFNSGSNVGAILAPLAVPIVAVTWGWQAAFLFTGVLSAIWLVTWLVDVSPAWRSIRS